MERDRLINKADIPIGPDKFASFNEEVGNDIGTIRLEVLAENGEKESQDGFGFTCECLRLVVCCQGSDTSIRNVDTAVTIGSIFSVQCNFDMAMLYTTIAPRAVILTGLQTAYYAEFGISPGEHCNRIFLN